MHVQLGIAPRPLGIAPAPLSIALVPQSQVLSRSMRPVRP